MRPESHRVEFLLAFPGDPHLYQIIGEYITGGKELVVLFECVNGLGHEPGVTAASVKRLIGSRISQNKALSTATSAI